MSFRYIAEIPTSREIREMMPLPEKLRQVKEERDREIREIFLGKDPRFLLVIGPCSADREEPVMEYIHRLALLQEEVKDRILMIPRIYTNKPRTTGEGYKGMMHQPDPEKAPNVLEGIKAIRRLHIRSLEETGLSGADEMLYPGNDPYVSDLLSYVAVGARSVENQQHRITASGLDIPVGMKNPTCGDISVMLNSIMAAQMAHTLIYDNHEVKSSGKISAATADAALGMLDVDAQGLDVMDRKFLEAILHKFSGGPVGLDNVAAAIGESTDTIEDVIEPYLIQQGFLQRTPRGRMATERSYLHFGLKFDK